MEGMEEQNQFETSMDSINVIDYSLMPVEELTI